MASQLYLLLLSAVVLTTASPVSFQTGNFQVTIDLDNLPTVTVTQKGQDGAEKPVWSSPKSSGNFIAAAKINDTVLQNGGNYVFANDTPEALCIGEVSKYSFNSSVVTLTGNLCSVTAFAIHFQGLTNNQLEFSVAMYETAQYNQLRLSYFSDENEQFYGFGVQYSVFNMKGHRLPVFLSEQGVGRGLEPFTAVLDSISPGAGVF